MNLKQGLSILTLTGGLLATSCDTKDVKSSPIMQNEPELMDLIPSLSRDSLLTLLENKKLDADEYDCYLDLINQKPNTDTLTIDMDRIKN